MEITEKEKAIARMKITAESIRANREAKEFFVKEFFAERKKLSEMINKSLDKAIEIGDTEIAELALQMINTMYEKNIFEIKKNMFWDG